MMETQKELFDEALLKVMANNPTRYGLNVDALALYVRQFQFQPGNEDVLDRIDYLATRRPPLVEEVLKGVHKANRAWRITDAGRAYLDERGL